MTLLLGFNIHVDQPIFKESETAVKEVQKLRFHNILYCYVNLNCTLEPKLHSLSKLYLLKIQLYLNFLFYWYIQLRILTAVFYIRIT